MKNYDLINVHLSLKAEWEELSDYAHKNVDKYERFYPNMLEEISGIKIGLDEIDLSSTDENNYYLEVVLEAFSWKIKNLRTNIKEAIWLHGT